MSREIPLLDLKAQYQAHKQELHNAIDEVMESGQYIMGPYVKNFEDEIASYVGVKHAIGVANGTDALLLSLDALGIEPGDEIITSPFTFFASAEVISQMGATPVFVDIDAQTYNLDVSKLEAAITPRTRALIPVHIFGQPINMEPIMQLAEKYNLYVIEDACQAIGSTYKGKQAGSIGTCGCFSFFPTKNLGGYGDGGIIVTDDDELARKTRILRFHGSSPKYYHSMIGYNSRLDALQAAMLSVKLKSIDTWNDARIEKAMRYNEAFKNTPLVLPFKESDRRHVYHLYILQADNRQDLIEYLAKHGIATGIYYPVPLHQQEVYKHLGYELGSLPVAERMAERTFAIPLYPELTDSDQDYVIDTILKYYK
ncbi:DegT/DnrJ/EryC1/StrS family aminotransferase [Desulfuribacillus alkaliarsenatis]|uniref:Transcriptional regulator n=1 Tax=Desulfuribacillus alkaliarsenatis TaxID=766136 RepID=A0A1E5G2R5_9FIRM|nr:DegT/DnrJ/EryC1/StrS family aminotransferase [Desulfuribacillus alkaliarsenatis]OEF96821.1 transcriptional regulator [Desulfuribacillus alkaliarsenatis]